MLYFILKLIGIPVINLLFLPKVVGKKHTRIKGKCIIVCNHQSMWDPLFLAISFPRQIHFMGKSELFKNRFLRWFFISVNVFPVKRGEGDLSAIRHSFKLLREGKMFGIFAEGTRSETDEMQSFEPGTAMIALKNDAPVIPIYIKGKYKVFRRMKMVIGKPIRLADYVGSKINAHTVAEATVLLENKVKHLRDTKETW